MWSLLPAIAERIEGDDPNAPTELAKLHGGIRVIVEAMTRTRQLFFVDGGLQAA